VEEKVIKDVPTGIADSIKAEWVIKLERTVTLTFLKRRANFAIELDTFEEVI
jgi:hypothetical protein